MACPDQRQPRYIPVGCLLFDRQDSRLLGRPAWPLPVQPVYRSWLQFSQNLAHATYDIDSLSDNFCGNPPCLLPEGLQWLLLTSKVLFPYRKLLYLKWIQMTFSVSLDDVGRGIIRVYVLADDVGNREVPRDDGKLRKARLRLMRQLDYSQSTWRGTAGISPSPGPKAQSSLASLSNGEDGEEASLLEMFNSIPSPSPQPTTVEDPYNLEAMYSLLNNNIHGIKTTLYPHQCRSAALMIEKESRARQFMDPRLQTVVDQEGSFWYYDASTGSSFCAPRLYDAPCGGILAEEMGSGKTLICLALIFATKHIPAKVPDMYRKSDPIVRPTTGSFADMAAACISREGVPWKLEFPSGDSGDEDRSNAIRVIQRNLYQYTIPSPSRQRSARLSEKVKPPRLIYPSHASLVIVPPNLLQQWKDEVAKHTTGLKLLVIEAKDDIPSTEQLRDCDIALLASNRTEWLSAEVDNGRCVSPFVQVHFKRCIVDEGHKLGNATYNQKTNLHIAIDCLQTSARWVVTGTPTRGLRGVGGTSRSGTSSISDGSPNLQSSQLLIDEGSRSLEDDDLRRIGCISKQFLKLRPWANTNDDLGDTPADWSLHFVRPRNDASRRSATNQKALRAILELLIVRHRATEIDNLLPAVDQESVYLDGSYQDTLVLNLFSMMIIFNAVQSQRTDQDYFFHPRQKKALIQLTSNLRQASFFGGPFFSLADLKKAINTAESFLAEGRVSISADDEVLLRSAIKFGHLAVGNSLKNWVNVFHEIPIHLLDFPWGAGKTWSLDLEEGEPVCTDPRMVLALQKLLQHIVDAPSSLQHLYESGRFSDEGRKEREKATQAEAYQGRTEILAGNTQLGQDETDTKRRRSVKVELQLPAEKTPASASSSKVDIARPLEKTRMISTASAKLSYLIDEIIKYQEKEQIIIFYDNDNVAYYIGGMLEILLVHHLIYGKHLTTTQRAQYVTTFNNSAKFRVLLMDINLAAFGLDMRSASRVYFINPVLNPQVEAQAIGRVRRISQKKPVTVRTLVLRGSLEEMIVKRRAEMTQAEQRKCRSILDDKPMYEFILNARILPLPGGDDVAGPDQMAKLEKPQLIFGREFGRQSSDLDRGLLSANAAVKKRMYSAPEEAASEPDAARLESDNSSPKRMKAGGVRFEGVDD
ncbi:P-loop containing nucleoside triphosphate hydrolase protein [Bombardia bombarda]|uniref:P-loop containing nucleoside triphosphate hydrolase protein n=1 Tax=Bombardia bombarda TaxID=252184 RepID=A0AA39X7X9_9PEZI|nr:P-loop containing nucleoside triphosphate hydrolase protein [Bombardia bombarda]